MTVSCTFKQTLKARRVELQEVGLVGPVGPVGPVGLVGVRPLVCFAHHLNQLFRMSCVSAHTAAAFCWKGGRWGDEAKPAEFSAACRGNAAQSCGIRFSHRPCAHTHTRTHAHAHTHTHTHTQNNMQHAGCITTKHGQIPSRKHC